MKLQVLNPVARKVEKREAPAPRLSQLEGKSIGLYWNFKGGGDAALRRTRELLEARYPGVKTKTYVGSIGGSTRRITKEDVKRIVTECEAVIGTTAD